MNRMNVTMPKASFTITVEGAEAADLIAAVQEFFAARAAPVELEPDDEWTAEQVELMWRKVTPDYRELVMALFSEGGSASMEELMSELEGTRQEVGGRLSSPGHQARLNPQLAVQKRRKLVFWDPGTERYTLQPEAIEPLRQLISDT